MHPTPRIHKEADGYLTFEKSTANQYCMHACFNAINKRALNPDASPFRVRPADTDEGLTCLGILSFPLAPHPLGRESP